VGTILTLCVSFQQSLNNVRVGKKGYIAWHSDCVLQRLREGVAKQAVQGRLGQADTWLG
jgi:hypothetical protein